MRDRIVDEPIDPGTFYTVADVARLYRVSESTVRRAMARGELSWTQLSAGGPKVILGGWVQEALARQWDRPRLFHSRSTGRTPFCAALLNGLP